MSNLRTIYVWKKSRSLMSLLKPGDVFSMSGDEYSDKNLLLEATGKPEQQTGKPKGYLEVDAREIGKLKERKKI